MERIDLRKDLREMIKRTDPKTKNRIYKGITKLRLKEEKEKKKKMNKAYQENVAKENSTI